MKLKLFQKRVKRAKWRDRKRSGNRYTTFLPEMTEGNNLPLQLKPGFALMDRADPNGWLSGVSRTMATSGTDVGYSIPDVMAVEQQIRRLIRLPRTEALHHQEMRDWRAVLAILLLWDGWEKDEFWPELRMTDYIQPEEDEAPSSFRSALIRAVSKRRAREGVRIFSLYRTMDLVTESVPLALVSSETIIAPAANMAERLMERLLPSVVTWYNRDKKRFEDPTEYLSDLDRLRLVMQLRILQEMNADEELGSCIYTGRQNHLVGLLEQFIQDLNDYRFSWRYSLGRADSPAMTQLYDRIVAVKGLYRSGGDTSYVRAVERHEYPLEIASLIRNPLLMSLLLDASDTDAKARRLNARHVEDTVHVYYTFNDIPFAREDPIYILEPMNDPHEEEAIEGIRMEASMLRNYSNQWNTEFGQSLVELSDSLSNRVGTDRVIAEQIRRWARRHLDVPLNVNHTITLHYPLEGEPETLRALMKEFLGMETLDTIYDVFSDRLMVVRVPDGQPAPLPEGFAAHARVRTDMFPGETLYGMLPLSERMATWLMYSTATDDGTHASFVPASLTLKTDHDEQGAPIIRAGYAIERVVTSDTAIVSNCVRFEREYELVEENTSDDNLLSNAVEWLSWNDAPSVVLWPNLLLPSSDWRAYWLYVSDSSRFTPWVMKDGRWQAMLANRYPHANTEWLSLQTNQFPTFILLKHGGVTCGALYNPCALSQVRSDDAVTIAVDFGTTATAIALKQGRHIFRMMMDEPLHGFMLRGCADVTQRLYSEFLPLDAMLPARHLANPNVISSMVQLFSHNRGDGCEPLVDGCVYDHPDIKTYSDMPVQSLYCNLKWGREAYRKRYVYLYLKQCMIQAMMVARQHGAPSVSWRFATPTSLSVELRAEYVDCVTSLVNEVVKLTGVPLTEGQPPLVFLSENEADGAFFMHEDMVDVRNGYINIDVGGNTSDISLWLNAEHEPAFEQSLEFGCHRLLYESVEQWPERFKQDFPNLNEEDQQEMDRLLNAITEGAHEPIRRELAMFLFDRWIARWTKNPNRQSAPYTMSLVTLSASFLYYMSGVMIKLANGDEAVKAKMPDHLQVCFAGNGGRLFSLLSAEQTRKARDFAWLCFEDHKAMVELLPVQSTHPKQEVALGLLYSTLGHTAQEVVAQQDAPININAMDPAKAGEYFAAFFVRFAQTFPEEARLLMNDAYEDDFSGLTHDAQLHVQMVVNNQFSDQDKATLVSFVNSFTATKKAWGV